MSTEEKPPPPAEAPSAEAPSPVGARPPTIRELIVYLGIAYVFKVSTLVLTPEALAKGLAFVLVAFLFAFLFHLPYAWILLGRSLTAATAASITGALLWVMTEAIGCHFKKFYFLSYLFMPVLATIPLKLRCRIEPVRAWLISICAFVTFFICFFRWGVQLLGPL